MGTTKDRGLMHLGMRAWKSDASAAAEFHRILIADDRSLVDITMHGIRAAVIVHMAIILHIQPPKLGEFIGISRSSLGRWVGKKTRLDLVSSDRFVRYAQLWKLARHLWGSDEAAQEWLTSPEPALAGSTPLEFAITEIGARKVEDLLGQLAHGIAT